MELLEYHVKRIFKEAGLPVLKGDVAYTPEEALYVAGKIGEGPYLLKAQALGGAGCYGKVLPVGAEENGCACVAQKAEVSGMAYRLLGAPDWMPNAADLFEVQKVYVEQAVCDADILGSLVFRVNFEKQSEMLMVAPKDKKPVSFLLLDELTDAVLQKAVKALCGRDKKSEEQAVDIFKKAHALFQAYGAVAVELSPVVRTKEGELKIVDGRLVFDPNSTYKFPELVPLIESRVGKEREKMARQNRFRYMGMKGNIACVVNGIGLGWATVDLIHRKGGKVAALLDVGTKPTKETVNKALRLVLSEPNVDGILVNIFGGLTRCDLIAQGLLEASSEMSAGLPLVVRMDGMNAELGQRILFESRLPFLVVGKMDEAVRLVIQKVKEKR